MIWFLRHFPLFIFVDRNIVRRIFFYIYSFLSAVLMYLQIGYLGLSEWLEIENPIIPQKPETNTRTHTYTQHMVGCVFICEKQIIQREIHDAGATCIETDIFHLQETYVMQNYMLCSFFPVFKMILMRHVCSTD